MCTQNIQKESFNHFDSGKKVTGDYRLFFHLDCLGGGIDYELSLTGIF